MLLAHAYGFPFVLHQESLEKQRSRLVGNDASFVIELAFVQQMTGELGKQTLQDKCLQCLPSSATDVTPDVCYKNIVAITTSELWQFVDKSSHGEVEKVKKWVESMASGFAAKPPVAHSSGFLLQAWGCLGYFARETKRQKIKKDGHEEVKETHLFGADALKIKFEAVKKKGDKVGSDDLKLLVSLRHLLDDAMRTELTQMSAEVSDRLSSKRPAASQATHTSQPKKAKTEAVQEAESAADDVFS
eukprot:1231028-Amphidinium_carterae.4